MPIEVMIAYIPLKKATSKPIKEQICKGTVEKLVAIFPYNFKSLNRE